MKFQDLALLTVEERSEYIRIAAGVGPRPTLIEKDSLGGQLLEQLFALSSTVTVGPGATGPMFSTVLKNANPCRIWDP
jgi:hypothetical protein